MIERLPELVTGPKGSLGVDVVELVDTPGCDPGFCGFESRRSPLRIFFNGVVSSVVEHLNVTQRVAGSIPVLHPSITVW